MSKSGKATTKSAVAKAADKAPSGMRAKTLGMTWWGQRWIEALERSSRDVVARLGKGRAYARDGHVHGLKVAPGKVTATVTDDELDSYGVSLNLEVFDARAWNQILQVMSQQALFAAQLLNGEMPRDVDRLFRSCGKGLFPANSHDIDADCSCDDWSSPCKHVAATHYVLGEALDRDPFLLFELRGRSKEQVLAGLNKLRAHLGGHETDEADTAPEKLSAAAHTVSLGTLAAQNFENGATPLPVLSFNFDRAPVAGALLRSLGTPASWSVHETPQDLLGPALVHARLLACELATGNGQLPTVKSIAKSKVATRSRQVRTRKPDAADPQ